MPSNWQGKAARINFMDELIFKDDIIAKNDCIKYEFYEW